MTLSRNVGDPIFYGHGSEKIGTSIQKGSKKLAVLPNKEVSGGVSYC
jgi:hypothetical protein